MPDHTEPLVSQRVHDLDLVAGNLAHAVRRMIRRGRRFAAIAEASKISGDHGEVLGELRRYPMPHEMRLGDAVQQQDRWTVAAATPVNRRTRRSDIELFETVKHEAGPSLWSADCGWHRDHTLPALHSLVLLAKRKA